MRQSKSKDTVKDPDTEAVAEQETEPRAESMTLYDLGVGQTAWVTSIELSDANMRRRLQDLGIINGTRVLCRQAAPSGNPKSYLVRGATIAIRKADSSQVLITTVEPPRDYAES